MTDFFRSKINYTEFIRSVDKYVKIDSIKMSHNVIFNIVFVAVHVGQETCNLSLSLLVK